MPTQGGRLRRCLYAANSGKRWPTCSRPWGTTCKPIKTKEGTSHPDCNAQFAYINTRVRAFQKRGYPVVSVDTKKKELVGDFKNEGQEWRPQGQLERVRVYDFVDEDLGKTIPYGVHDQAANIG